MTPFADALAAIPAPIKRPALQMPCDTCTGSGYICDGHCHEEHSGYCGACAACDGTGEIDATCQICGGDDPAVEVITTRDDGKQWRACESCVAENKRILVARAAKGVAQ